MNLFNSASAILRTATNWAFCNGQIGYYKKRSLCRYRVCLTTELQLRNSGGQVFLYRDGEEVDRSIEYTHSTEGISWQRRIDGLDTDSDGDWIERDSAFGVPT